MTIFNKLKFTGIEIGHVQSVDEMTVIPILGDDRGDVALPEHLKFKSTTEYGVMVFENDHIDMPAIVPTNMMVRGKEGQDHAMSGSGIVLAKSTQSFDTACCIEESQGGYLTSDNNDEDILPIDLRKAFLSIELRKQEAYNKLWPNIKRWLKGLGVYDKKYGNENAAHLQYFYDHPVFKVALEQFAAEFEPVDNQIGAIIMFSGVPVGIEVMPSNDHWEAYWKLLLRGCYGAEMIRLKMLGKMKEAPLVLPEIPKGSSPTKVKRYIEDFRQELRQGILPILESIDIRSQKLLDRNGSLQTDVISTSSGGGGDLIQQNNVPIYLSLIL